MKTIKALTLEEVTPQSQEIFRGIKSKLGMLPNLYATMGNSDKLLSGLLQFEATLKQGEFTNKEHEAIALIVSEVNGCNYCLSAHTALGKMNGFSEEETVALRNTNIDDQKLNALVTLAKDITINRGHATSENIDTFFEVGYNKTALAELIGTIAKTIITNYIYSIGDFEIDFPLAPGVNALQES